MSPTLNDQRNLPEALIPLATISGAFSHNRHNPSQHTAALAAALLFLFPTIHFQSPVNTLGPSTLQVLTGTTRQSTLRLSFVAHDTRRHLHIGCKICVEAKLPTRQGSALSGSDPSQPLTWAIVLCAGSSSSFPTAASTSWQTTSGTNWKFTSGGKITGCKEDRSGIQAC